jgi:hypothetical protein
VMFVEFELLDDKQQAGLKVQHQAKFKNKF